MKDDRQPLRPTPSSAVLKDQDLLFPEAFSQMLCIGIDAAQKLVSSGRVGPPFRLGKRVLVFKEDFYTALRAQITGEALGPASSPIESPLSELPRRRRGRGRHPSRVSGAGSPGKVGGLES